MEKLTTKDFETWVRNEYHVYASHIIYDKRINKHYLLELESNSKGEIRITSTLFISIWNKKTTGIKNIKYFGNNKYYAIQKYNKIVEFYNR